MMILWRRLHKDFLKFVDCTRPFGRSGNFYEAARGQHPTVIILSSACWEPQLSEKYRVERGSPNISGSKILKLFKSRWVLDCRAAGGIPKEFAVQRGRDLGINTLGINTTTVPVPKLHESHIVKSPIFIYDWRSYRGGKIYAFWIVTTILQCCYRILHENGF